jgi:hypothetical protein
MRLWLDDTRPAPAGFDIVVSTAEDAIAAIESGKVTYCSLDHDLSYDPPDLEHYNGIEGTGYEVATFIEEAAYQGTLPRLAWRVHSANPAGAARMTQALRAADFYWDRREDAGMKTSQIKYRFKVSATKFTHEEAKVLAANLGIDFEAEGFDLDQFTRGLNVEREHGSRDPSTNVTCDDPLKTGKIAWAHLKELPDYYVRLETMEQGQGEADVKEASVPPQLIKVWGGVYRLAVQGRETNPRQLADKIELYMNDIMSRMQRETAQSVQKLKAAVLDKNEDDLSSSSMEKLRSLEDRCKVLYEDTWTILDDLNVFDAGSPGPALDVNESEPEESEEASESAK